MSQQTIETSQLTGWVRARSSASERYLFGIAGPPGSGKTAIATRLAEDLDVPVVPMDGFHLPNAVLDDRGLRRVKGSPNTFDAAAFVTAVERLRSSSADLVFPSFDRVTDEPTPDRIRVPGSGRIVIVEGNYLLLDLDPWSALIDLFDAVAYVDLDRETRLGRLIDRHVEFGKTLEAATVFVHESDEANTELIEATRTRADLIVRST